MLVPIVEGHGEVQAVPVLLRRLLPGCGGAHLGVARPFLVKRNKVVKVGELERAIEFAVSDRANARALLVVLDADDDDPIALAAALQVRAEETTHLPIRVVVASREYESWLLASKETLRGLRGIRDDAVAPTNPESLRAAKSHLTFNMVSGRRYLEVDDQASLTSRIDFDLAAARSASFGRLIECVTELAAATAT